MIPQPVDSYGPGPAFRLQFRADPAEVRQALRKVHATLTRERVRSEDRAIAELVLAEVLNNIAEHAYAGCSDGLVDLAMTLTGDRLACQFTDQGLPFPSGAPPQAHLGGHDPEDLPEGGFGWPLIHRLTRDLSYRRTSGRNHLDFWLPAVRQG